MTTADKIRHAIASRIGYEVRPHGFAKTHHTITKRAALEWAHCYRRATITKRGQFIANTTTTQGA
jgi:hypothetical protein